MKESKDISDIKALYESLHGVTPDVELLPGAGSGRRYYRLSSPGLTSVIAAAGDDKGENRCFVNLAIAFREAGIATPEILAVSDDYSVYLQEDLGDVSVLSLLAGKSRIKWGEEAMKALVSMQTTSEDVWGDRVICPPFSRRQVMWDLNYFKYEFLKVAGISFDEELLEDDFEKLAASMANISPDRWGFMYRDYQSRNLMVKNGELRMIDFQGGRKGPLLYDAVSFLWQAKAGFTDEERAHLLRKYARTLASARGIEVKDILKDLDELVLLRTLQVAGAYGLRGLVEKKSHFIESLPGAMTNLGQLIEKGAIDRYPELKKAARKCVESRFARRFHADRLVVKVFSFSYKKGYPEDLTGNGGGFMFDCRGMSNPGRYDKYKSLTGLDQEVIDFLVDKGEVELFLERAIAIVSPSIDRYLKRGFTSLQVGFGCTGGRHRSVYCAQKFAETIAYMYPDVTVELLHREQHIEHIYNKEK